MNLVRPAAFDTLDRVAERSAAAVLGWSALRSQALRSHLLASMPANGDPNAFLADPVIEAAHGWATASETFGDLAGTLLSESVIAALDGAGMPDPDGRERYRLPRDRHPYTHQLDAWRHLLDETPRSVLVTSGTGSGKTECFVVPLLEHLARAARARGAALRGVQALMLYPLNALINSQRERLSDWTRPFNGDLRFCLYNGETPKDLQASEQDKTPEEVRSRHRLRRDPPPILVTNITMLEYLLIRAEDQPILQRSQGQLRYVILDEAHSYVGSQAAELSLLLRRVVRAFGVDPERVRFVATSATIGRDDDRDTHETLAKFLADVAGVPRACVSVVEGHRRPPDLPPARPDLTLPTLAELQSNDPAALFERLGATPAFRRGFESLKASPRTAAQWFETVGVERSYGAALLAAAARAQAAPEGLALQPLKVHGFHRSQGGLWACADVRCSGRVGTPLDASDWPFGAVFQERIDRCAQCEGPVFEVVFCSACGETALDALREPDADGIERLIPARAPLAEDEFLSELVETAPQDDPDDEPAGRQTVDPARVLVASPEGRTGFPVPVARATGVILETGDPAALALTLSDPAQCPHCRVPFDGKGLRLLNFRVSGPFLLGSIVPELVTDAQPMDARAETGGPLPADGRQILTFTDSRQGTARLAAKLQRDAERNHVRTLLYHAVQARTFLTDDQRAQIDELTANLAQIDATIAAQPAFADALALGRKTIVDRIDSLRPSETRLSWGDALGLLQKDETCRRWIRDEIWAEREDAFLNDAAFARFLVLREVIRPPAKANSLENMGLLRLCFRHIDETVTRPPAEFTRHGGTLEDWRDFLTIALTRVFRGNVAVVVDRDTLHWIMPDIPARFIVPPGSGPFGGTKRLAWPQPISGSKRRPIVLSLLAAGLKLDLDNPTHRDDVIACMARAWEAVWPVLKTDAVAGTQLDPDKIILAPLREAFVCPVTRRIVDRTFRGLSPNPRGSDAFLPAEPIALPAFPFSFGRSGPHGVAPEAVEAWLREDPQVLALRRRGHWSDLHDRIARRDTFYRSAEHSAQQSGRKLRAYEKAFRRGQINVLNCSTTMEMGVDIGSIGTVLMTNVPPSAASYRQRVGRAGRRGQPLALSLTLCKHRPTELSVFRNPLGLLTRSIAAPSVSLDSAVIAQRHVNALLLARFLKATGAELPKLETGYFYGLLADGERTEVGRSPAEHFIAWVDAPTTRTELSLAEDLRVLVRGTPFEDRVATALDGSRDQLINLRGAFEREWEIVRADLLVAAKERAAAETALKIAMRRLTGEYLLTELASRSFLPAHGFPTDVVPFDNSNAFIKERRAPDQDDDAAKRTRFREAPSRQLDLAIRDYAPGSEIVLDGVVFRSAGVRLDWKRPASETSVPEIQALRFAWRCERCGATDTAHRQPEACPSCGEAGRALKWHRYLRPSGFTCDPVTKPHSQIESVAFVPPRLPWVAARGGAWTAFADPEVGRFRASRNGMVFHYTSGSTEHGYAVCLCCGRAAPETGPRDVEPALPGDLPQVHRPLRTSRKEQPVCDAQDRPFAIQRHQYLGHETITDVLELQLTGLEGPAIGHPIAAALRDALAQKLGVEPGEIGFAITQTREAEGAEPRWSIFLFDRAAGGAGFSVWAGPRLVELLASACAILNCRNGDYCRHGCVDCVLSRDLENQAIDRIGALAFITGAVLPRLAVPEADLLFAPAATLAEMQPLADAIMREMEKPGVSLTLWIGGDVRDWDLERWAAIRLVHRLILRDQAVEIIAPQAAINGADASLRVSVFGLLMKSGATVRQVSDPYRVGNGMALAHVGDEKGGVLWASRSTESTVPGTVWGTASAGSIVRGDRGRVWDRGTILEPGAFLKTAPDTVLIDVGPELDGSVSTFGPGFWRLLGARAPALAARIADKAPLTALHYSDRYLLAPLPLRLVYEVLSHAPGLTKQTELTLETAFGSNRHQSSPYAIEHDWLHDPHCAQVTEALIKPISAKANIRRIDKRDLPHGRTLVLRFATGPALRIVLDQGVGYWRSIQRGTRFDFTQAPAHQAVNLRSMPLRVQAGSTNRTWVVVATAR